MLSEIEWEFLIICTILILSICAAIVFTYSEKIIIGLLKADVRKDSSQACAITNGLTQSMKRVQGSYPGISATSPRILLLELPYPEAMVLRSPGSPGTFLVSKGFIAQATEADIRNLFLKFFNQLSSKSILWRTQKLVAGIWTLRFIPKSWLTFGGFLNLPTPALQSILIKDSLSPSPTLPGPFSMLFFLMLYPYLKWVLAPLTSKSQQGWHNHDQLR